MNEIKIVSKSFFRNPFYDALLGGGLLYLFLRCPALAGLSEQSGSLYDAACSAINLLSAFLAVGTFVCFGAFMLLAYAFLRCTSAQHLEETLQCIPSGQRRTAACQLFLLMLLAAAISAAIWALCMTPLSAWLGKAMPKALAENVFLSVLLYAFLPALAGILLGAAWQRLDSRIGFYVFFVFSMFLISPMAGDFFLAAGQMGYAAGGTAAGIATEKILDLWYRMSPIYNSFVDPAYGIAAEPYRFALAGFWGLLGLSVLLGVKTRRRTRAAGAVSMALCLLCAVFAWQRGSDPQEHLAIPLERLAQSDAVYYAAADGGENRPADFSVTACQLEMRCFSRLKASATLRLDGTYCRQYAFTLYHGYRVASVTGLDGQALSFTQTGDSVVVENPTASAIEQMTFRYGGYHPALYSSAQGIFLPGYFCYYPIEGTWQVFGAYALNNVTARLSPRAFTLSVTGGRDVYTNLTAKEDGTFAGTARSLTVVSGMYQETAADGVRCVRPWCLEDQPLLPLLREEVRTLNETLGTSFSLPDYQAVFYSPDIKSPLPDGGTGRCVAAGDTLLVGTTMQGADRQQAVYAHCVDQLKNAPEGPVKQWFFTVLQDVLQGNGTGSLTQAFGAAPSEAYAPVDSMTPAQNENREIGFYIDRGIRRTSLPAVMNKLFVYLSSGGSEEALSFVKTLGEEA